MKTPKNLWRISVATSLEAEDAVTELLGTIFNCSFSSYFNVETQTSIVSIYFLEKNLLSREVRAKIFAGLNRIKHCGLKIGSGKILVTKVRREDWAESWKRHFKPKEIGGALLVKPSWSKKRPRKNQAVVILDPGLSFGTGQHPTTSFCLREICRVGVMRQQSSHRLNTIKSFLDIGTGSGILAIAAAKLGFKPIRAFDFDPEAVRVARANARVNGVDKKLEIVRGDVAKLSIVPRKKFDLVCANLISNLLIAERTRILPQLNDGGTLVLAGILKSEFTEVQKEFESLGLKQISAKSEKEWRSGAFRFAKK
jgi:ribosomal protein L11 methyltransferase